MNKKHVGPIYLNIHWGLKVQEKNGPWWSVYCRAKLKTSRRVLEAPRTQKTACFTHLLEIVGCGGGGWPAGRIIALYSNVRPSELAVSGFLI